MTRELRIKGACIALGFLICLYLVYPTIRWSLYSDDERTLLLSQWKEEQGANRDASTRIQLQFSMKRWWQGDRSRVLNLGLDLQGGLYVELEVQLDDALRVSTQTMRERLKDTLTEKNVEYQGIIAFTNTAIELTFTNTAAAQRALTVIKAAKEDYAGVLSLPPGEVEGTSFRVWLKDDEKGRIKQKALEQAKYVVENRINQLGLTEPSIQMKPPSRIVVQIPGEKDPKRVTDLIRQTAKLEFHMLADDKLTSRVIERINDVKRIKDKLVPRTIPTEKGAQYREYMVNDGDTEAVTNLLASPEVQRCVPPNYMLMLSRAVPDKGYGGMYREFMLVERDVAIDGMSLRDARVTVQDVANNRVVSLSLDAQGRSRLSRVSRDANYKYENDNIVSRLAIILDDTVYSAPTLLVHIPNGSAQIEGHFDEREAADLSLVLRSGALPAKLVAERELVVGATLGNDSIRKGVISGLIGAAAVVVFMVVYYLLAGMVAIAALVLNMLILLGVLAMFHATLTLPGIAGIILTVGMAVDANVLIYERIREELAAGKAIRQAIKDGFDRAWVVIFDANLTTIITASILFWLGTGPIRGFGLTLIIGLVANLLTAVFVCRYIFDIMLLRGHLTSLKMLQLFKRPNLNVMGVRNYCISATVGITIVGLVVFGIRYANQTKALAEGKVQVGTTLLHKPIRGIELTGGDVVKISFANAVEIGAVRQALAGIGLGDSTIQHLDKPNQVMIRSAYNTGTKAVEALKTAIAGNPFVVSEKDRIGPAVGKELVRNAFWAIALSLVLMVIYLWYRFEFQYGVGAFVALLHDVLLTMGVFAITGRQISLTVIAALLTIVGYSVNDTIVVFDRIREDIKLGKGSKLEDIMNLAVNQTLSRTTLTSATVIMVVFAQYLWGGEVINDFAFALLVGVITGTYSSIYIASPIVLIWNRLIQKGR